MVEQQIIRIKEILGKQGIDIELLESKKLMQLCMIDDEIQKRLSNIRDLKKKIDENSINIASISKNVKIARKTIYNNWILKKYIEFYSVDAQKEIEKCKYNNLINIVGEYAKELKLLQKRDIDNENLKYENERLQKEIKLLNDKIKTLENQIFNSKNEFKN